MKPQLVTFDCAQTLLDVRWQMGEYAVGCALEAGLDLDQAAAASYSQLFRDRHSEYLELNKTRDAAKCDVFWAQLTKDWLDQLGHEGEQWQPRLEEVSQQTGFSPDSQIFKVFDDVIPCLEQLSARNVRTAVISNWDYSLHRILNVLDLHYRFDVVVASLEEGMEKPDPRLFRIVLDKLGVEPANGVHVGDDPLDDLQGARNVGMGAFLIDRNLTAAKPPYIASLLDLPGALGWND